METRTQDPAGYYVWEVPGQSVVVHLRLDIVDRLAAEVMRGFGSVPKRGAEVGGFLIGAIHPAVPAIVPGVSTIVRIDDFEPVACEYRRGPSYLFTEQDGVVLAESWRRLQSSVSPSAYAVGYFRSNTRDGSSLVPEDLEILDRFFPDPAHVALLIKPYASKASVGGFLIRENGTFPKTTDLEFPLRRHELLGEEPEPRRSLAEKRMEGRVERPARAVVASPVVASPVVASPVVASPVVASPVVASPEESPQAAFGFAGSEPAPPQDPEPASGTSLRRSGWVWLPLIFLFMLIGLALGYQLAVTRGARAAAIAGQDLSLSLSVKKSGDNLRLSWSSLSPAIRSSQRGLLEIDDGGYTRPVALDAAQLQNGSLIYRSVSNSVRFRMTVFPQARVSVVETLEWKQ